MITELYRCLSGTYRNGLNRFQVTLTAFCPALLATILLAPGAGCGGGVLNPFDKNHDPEVESISVNGNEVSRKDDALDPKFHVPHLDVPTGSSAVVTIRYKDKDNDPLEIAWTGATETAKFENSGSATVTSVADGLNLVTLLIKDDRGRSISTGVALTGIDAEGNRPPTITLKAAANSVVAGEKVAVTATGADADNDPSLTYAFYATPGLVTIPDASKPNEAEFTAPTTEGEATIIGIVTDSKKATGVATITVKVTKKP